MVNLEERRLAFRTFLAGILESENLYYSPPNGLQLKYPCIIYSLASPLVEHADNLPYYTALRWTVTIIDEDPDSLIASKFFNLPMCTFDREFQSDDLNHFVFDLYY